MVHNESRQAMHEVPHHIVAFDLKRFQVMPHPDALPIVLALQPYNLLVPSLII